MRLLAALISAVLVLAACGGGGPSAGDTCARCSSDQDCACQTLIDEDGLPYEYCYVCTAFDDGVLRCANDSGVTICTAR